MGYQKPSRQLNENELAVLQKELNYSQSAKKLPITDIVAGVEPALR